MNKKIIISFLSIVSLFAVPSHGQAPVADFTANDTIICAGDSVKFTDLSSNSPTSWSWTFNGGNPATSVLQNPEVYYGSAGVYSVTLTATNGSGSGSLTKTNFIVVKAAPVITVSPPAGAICGGKGDTLNASGALSYNWIPAAGLSCTACAQTVADPPSTTNYTVVGTNGAGCSDSATVLITVGFVNANITGKDSICQGTTDSLTASGGANYLWSTGVTNSTIGVSPSSTTQYSVLVSEGSCVDSAKFTVTVLASPTLTITGKDSMCAGGNVNLTANGATNYFWAPSSGLSCTSCPNPNATPTITTTYTVIGKNNNNCTNAASITINVIYPPSVSAGNAISVCKGDPVTLNAMSTSSGLIIWKPMNDTAQSVTFYPKTSGVYTVTLSGLCGTGMDTVTVDVLPSPIPDFSADVEAGCTPLCVKFKDMSIVNPGSITSCTWNFGDSATSNDINPLYCFTKPGKYTINLTVVSDRGCSATLTISNMISVYPPPDASFKYTPNPVTVYDPSVTFTDDSKDSSQIVQWIWTYGDNSDSVNYTKNTEHTYDTCTTCTYCPKLWIMDENGCRDSVTECFKLEPQFVIYIPGAFTPNGDDINETFAAKGLDISSFDMYIYDRWGMKLYYSNDMNDGWNGKVNGNGKICQEDTYVYKIDCTDGQGNQHHYLGKFELLK